MNDRTATAAIESHTEILRHPCRMEGGKRIRGEAVGSSASAAPLVSIITVVFNCAQYIEQALTSVLNQTYENIEYIVIDGGSTDGTLDIIRRYDAQLSYWRSEPDEGIYDAMNKGLDLATGDLIAFLNCDDYYDRSALASVAETYRKRGSNKRTVIYGDYYILDEFNRVKTGLRSNLKFWNGMSICHQAMFVSQDIYRAPALYDTSLRYAADYAFLIDAIRSGAEFVSTGNFIVTFGNTGTTYTNVLASHGEMMQVLRRRFGLWSKYFWILRHNLCFEKYLCDRL